MSTRLLWIVVCVVVVAVLFWRLTARVPFGGGVPAKVDAAGSCVARGGPIAAALERFKVDTGRYPSTSEGLRILLKPGQAGEPYLIPDNLGDPWGSPFAYRCPGVHNPTAYDLWSFGPNRRNDGGSGSGDDIGN